MTNQQISDKDRPAFVSKNTDNATYPFFNYLVPLADGSGQQMAQYPTVFYKDGAYILGENYTLAKSYYSTVQIWHKDCDAIDTYTDWESSDSDGSEYATILGDFVRKDELFDSITLTLLHYASDTGIKGLVSNLLLCDIKQHRADIFADKYDYIKRSSSVLFVPSFAVQYNTLKFPLAFDTENDYRLATKYLLYPDARQVNSQEIVRSLFPMGQYQYSLYFKTEEEAEAYDIGVRRRGYRRVRW